MNIFIEQYYIIERLTGRCVASDVSISTAKRRISNYFHRGEYEALFELISRDGMVEKINSLVEERIPLYCSIDGYSDPIQSKGRFKSESTNQARRIIGSYIEAALNLYNDNEKAYDKLSWKDQKAFAIMKFDNETMTVRETDWNGENFI